MKLTDAQKLATPGELFVSKSCRPGLGVYTGYDGMLILDVVQDLTDDQTRADLPSSEQAEANAALMVHWSEHGPKLLEEVKKEKRITDQERSRTARQQVHVEDIIEAAEEVDGI